jgi:hypothetical protein
MMPVINSNTYDKKGSLNQANNASKHHTPKHHKQVQPFYVFDCNTTPAQ